MSSPRDVRIIAYVHDVVGRIPAGIDRRRIEEDLLTHLADRVDAGDAVPAAIAAMGDPKEVAMSYLGERPMVYASISRRFLAAVIDNFILSVGFGMLAVPVIAAVAVSGYVEWEAHVALLFVAALVLWGLMTIVYFPVTEALYGQTLGKRMLGLVVVTEAGLAIGAKEAIIRRLPYLLNVAILLDGIFMFVGHKRQRAFDHVASTVVIRAT